jgi:hypothetical protein
MRQRWMVWAATVAVAACASALRRGDSNDPTIEIHNLSPAAIELHAILGVGAAGDTIGFLLGTVYAGKAACFRLQATTTPQWVKIRSMDGTYYTPRFVSASRAAWSLELTGNPETDRLALQPADAQCSHGA